MKSVYDERAKALDSQTAALQVSVAQLNAAADFCERAVAAGTQVQLLWLVYTA